MARVLLRFYEELNDFLPRDKRKVAFEHDLPGRCSVKDLIESLGVPHTEVDLILVNGESVDFSYIVREGARISVYPMFEALDISPLLRLRPRPLRKLRFAADANLGRLARYLRLLGFDTLSYGAEEDPLVAATAARQKRILLTRDRDLLKRRVITHGYYVRETNPRRQLIEIVARFDLDGSCKPFSRCLKCNRILRPVNKDAIAHRLPRRSREAFDVFLRCPGCGRLYWPGSHYDRMRRLIDDVKSKSRLRRTGESN